MNLEIKNRLEATLKKYELSQARAAREIGYSSPVLSAYRSGTYQGDTAKLEEVIVRWIARQTQSRERKRVEVVETDDLRRIVSAIQIAHTEKDVALVIADAGAWKSTAAGWYVENNEKAAVLVDVVSGMNRRMLVQEIARQLSLDTERVPLNTLTRNVSDTLLERDMVVILDEADYLKADAL